VICLNFFSLKFLFRYEMVLQTPHSNTFTPVEIGWVVQLCRHDAIQYSRSTIEASRMNPIGDTDES
jgi:hypothetical protein